MKIRLVDHPLARHLVCRLRDAATAPAIFRSLTNHLTIILALDATRDLRTRTVEVATPLDRAPGELLSAPLVVVPILRAGLGMLAPIVELFSDTSVGYIGLARDHTTAIASAYYCKLPDVVGRTTLIVDPMLATGGSACQAIDAVKAAGGSDIRLLCVVAAPEGVLNVSSHHPDVQIIGAALDRELNSQKYIVPGLGDFGDRLYGTL
ncbi:MAG: uracil phosphoribosyltransferase [Candidatus Eremiobacteraeota bacterium]|nr:uracil phosphoribosyltransferase [Candidatus Eremiobacteraeota bacterium]MBC5826610.1 uracil phosphoribosyltransferase [Candidatus Eremiobacteraeota bacterium]